MPAVSFQKIVKIRELAYERIKIIQSFKCLERKTPFRVLSSSADRHPRLPSNTHGLARDTARTEGRERDWILAGGAQ